MVWLPSFSHALSILGFAFLPRAGNSKWLVTWWVMFYLKRSHCNTLKTKLSYIGLWFQLNKGARYRITCDLFIVITDLVSRLEHWQWREAFENIKLFLVVFSLSGFGPYRNSSGLLHLKVFKWIFNLSKTNLLSSIQCPRDCFYSHFGIWVWHRLLDHSSPTFTHV